MISAYQFIDLVIRRDSLEQKEKGLSQKFIEKYKVESPHYDKNLICIRGSMSPGETEYKIKELMQEYGLVFNPNTNIEPVTDIIVVESFGMFPRKSWLKKEAFSVGGYLVNLYYFEENE